MSVEKVSALIERHGHDTVCSQALEPGLSYWFSADEQACVAYAIAGGSWVAAGGPICSPERRDEAMHDFARAAKEVGKRPRFFATEAECDGFTSVRIGQQAEWSPRHWEESLASKASLREQLRRARAKGVVVRGVEPGAICDRESKLHQQVRLMIRDWQQSRQMAPMRFLVTLDLFSHERQKRYFVAEREGQVVGLLVAAPIPARDGWFFENLLRAHDAPNGSAELLFDWAMRAAATEDVSVVSFGLAPLAGDVSVWLQLIRDHSRWLYDFEGLRSFKAKLLPEHWQQIYLSFPQEEGGPRATIDSLTAFAGGSWIGFGLRTLAHAHATLVWWFALLLVPWTVLLSQGTVQHWFPSAEVRAAWIGFDMLLFVGLVDLALCFRKDKALLLATLAGCDALLGITQLVQFNRHTLSSPLEWCIAALAIAAPLGAALVLAMSAHMREQLYLRSRLQTKIAVA
ncbi:MAG: DUF2156 domain-containing protein [Myxococcales bacterium]|nr:DUF2156 domain-containing protein [Myxococcales bacterium]